jgi:hypothetical protein
MCKACCTPWGRVKNAFKVLVGKHEKRELGRHRRRWKGSIKWNFKQLGLVVKIVMNGWVP